MKKLLFSFFLMILTAPSFSQSVEFGPTFGTSNVEGKYRWAMNFDFGRSPFFKRTLISVDKKILDGKAYTDFGFAGGIYYRLRTLNTMTPMDHGLAIHLGYGMTESMDVPFMRGFITGASYNIGVYMGSSLLLYLSFSYNHQLYGEIEWNGEKYNTNAGFLGISIGLGLVQ